MHGIGSRVVAFAQTLEAGFEKANRPCLLLLHGFPELAYSWRRIMLPLAAAGYYVVAPDQRGYGRTTGWDDGYDGDVDSFRLPNVVRDALGLVSALGYRSVAAVVGHDFGSPVAAYCGVLRPDVFRSVVLMSAPFEGPPPLPAEAILLGDFNAEPGSPEYVAVTRGTRPAGPLSDAADGDHHAFIDSWIAAGHQARRGITYRRNPAQMAEWDLRIDYCFLPLGMATRLVGTRTDAEAIGSDHQPVWVELRG